VCHSRRFWFEFHLTSLEGAPVPIITTVSIVTIQTRVVTGVIPPSSSATFSTVTAATLVIILVLGSESHTVMVFKLIPR